jgi:hypothetical protein
MFGHMAGVTVRDASQRGIQTERWRFGFDRSEAAKRERRVIGLDAACRHGEAN